MDEINYRIAKIEDAKDITYLTNTSLGYEISVEQTKQQLLKILNKSQYIVLVAEMDGRIVGYLQGGDYDCIYMPSLKDLVALAIDNRYQRRGIGKKLIEEFETWASKDGAIGIQLVSNVKRKEAHKFYQACGYHERKEQKNFIKYFDNGEML
ncbi:ribosomal protein S18 acetylase RimI-like enzyme [Breznakia sp. PF5-3]|uniref:GNAT family N-acetyltransferase n=1 Tax=unclassified Breznakia TaxID=2623764 RepID=UPI00240577EF|nr:MULTISPECIES: GNAT family N-acetyltransferase [unclassified Breznakia]MDF9824214.1 ribosomal protein S18 acetylase RimI-like enzyme [Breznakia sp. PM6-1]MDF9835012.1 ribosomal protein S18 acetylase RimI-like enzyme [Breznakia sp. PF5-3]MDF9837257.1 ribosomal protein S18 acetylase RimI-like enzyme [Breznakia sp. PFB2-8]MDF9859247.1 ribosomal protein S18 acetylase RimI-like enzyme [Breznakia sp. PH5-24]